MNEYALTVLIDKLTITPRNLRTINSNGVYALVGCTIVRTDTYGSTSVPFQEAKTCFLNQFLKTNKIKAL